MVASRAREEKYILPGHFTVVKSIKAFPKMRFYLYHPMVDRTERLGTE